MWFPYSLPTTWRVEGERARCIESLADDQPREFLIGFQLRNPVSREWSVELQLGAGEWGEQRDLTGQAVRVGYFPDESHRLAEIVCKLRDGDARGATRRAFDLVSRILDCWSAEYGRGFSIGGLRIADLKHDARWRLIPHWPSAQTFNAPDLEGLPEGFWPMARLYREGRTSSSDRHRFLCCLTIIEAWAQGNPPFDPAPEAATGTAIDLRVTQESMVLSGMHNFLPELEGLPLADLPGRLQGWHRAAVSFVLTGHEDGDLASPDPASEWAALANLVDLSAHQLLSGAMKQWRHHTARATHGDPEAAMPSTCKDSEPESKSAARPDSGVVRCSPLAYLSDMSRCCAPAALLSGRSRRFILRLSFSGYGGT
jgi:hypothetical protein